MTETSIRQDGTAYESTVKEAAVDALERFREDYPDAEIESFSVRDDDETNWYKYRIRAQD